MLSKLSSIWRMSGARACADSAAMRSFNAVVRTCGNQMTGYFAALTGGVRASQLAR